MSSAIQFNPGDTHKVLIGPGKPHTIHIVAIADGDMVVYKWYGRHQQWWHYEVEQSDFLETRIIRAKECV